MLATGLDPQTSDVQVIINLTSLIKEMVVCIASHSSILSEGLLMPVALAALIRQKLCIVFQKADKGSVIVVEILKTTYGTGGKTSPPCKSIRDSIELGESSLKPLNKQSVSN